MLSVPYKPVILNVGGLSVVAPSRVEHLKGRLQPYPQTLDKAGEACRGQTLLITDVSSFVTLGLGVSIIQL
jgi:hypothetical protein